jgi:hypothetical protein
MGKDQRRAGSGRTEADRRRRGAAAVMVIGFAIGVVMLPGAAASTAATEPVELPPASAPPELTPPSTPARPASDRAGSATSRLVPILVGLGVIGAVVTAVDSSIKRRRRAAPRVRSARAAKPPRRRPTSPRSPTPAPPAPAERGAPTEAGTAGASARARATELQREAERWSRGAAGEERVGRALDALPANRWWTRHDIAVGCNGVNIDHLVIGVGGVFSVNTKTSTGGVWIGARAFLVNGEKTAYYPKAAAEARNVRERLSRTLARDIEVWPVIAVVAERMAVEAQPSDLTVVAVDEIRAWLGSLPDRMSPHEAYAIVLAAHDPATWR